MNIREATIGAACLAAVLAAGKITEAGSLVALGLDDPEVIAPACRGIMVRNPFGPIAGGPVVCWQPGDEPDGWGEIVRIRRYQPPVVADQEPPAPPPPPTSPCARIVGADCPPQPCGRNGGC